MDKTSEEFLDEVLSVLISDVEVTRTRIELGSIKPAEAHEENKRAKGTIQQAILQHFQQEQEPPDYNALHLGMMKEPDLEKRFNIFLEMFCPDHYTHLIDTDDNAGEYIRRGIRSLHSQSEVDRLIREAVDAVLDELIEWYEAEKDFSAQPFNWYGAVKSLKVSKDYKKPFDTLSEQKEGSK